MRQLLPCQSHVAAFGDLLMIPKLPMLASHAAALRSRYAASATVQPHTCPTPGAFCPSGLCLLGQLLSGSSAAADRS